MAQNDPKQPTPQPEGKFTSTKWGIFDEGSLIPVKLVCQDYQPMQAVDASCHTALPVTAKSIVNHLNPEHMSGGGFEIHLRYREGAKTTFWQDLLKTEVELVDFRCDVCNAELNLNPRTIRRHIAPHAGKSRQARQGGIFRMTCKLGRVEPDAETWED